MKIIKTKSFDLAINTKGNKKRDKLAVFLPGRLDTKDYVNFTSHMNYLSNHGFYAVSVDFPGTWESPGEVEFTTTNYIKVVNELIEYFDCNNVLLFGHSRGGQTAILVGCENTSVKGIFVVNSSFGPLSPPKADKIKDGYMLEYRDLPPGNIRTKEKKEFNLSLNYFEDGKKYDTTLVLEKCTKPKAFVYGTQDEFMSPSSVKEIYKKISEPKMIYEIDTSHDYRLDSGAIEEVNEYLATFIEKYFV